MLISMVGSLQGVCVWLWWPLRSPKEPWETVALDSTGEPRVQEGGGRGGRWLTAGGLDLH